LSLPIAGQAREVYGIEAQGSAIRSAVRNSEINQLSNCTFKKSDVVKGCRDLVTEKQCFDIVICDPPRRGMAELVELVAVVAEKRVVYVSCDPTTLCRDLAKLVERGFCIQAVQPIDMFPQTYHIETVVLLEKNR